MENIWTEIWKVGGKYEQVEWNYKVVMSQL